MTTLGRSIGAKRSISHGGAWREHATTNAFVGIAAADNAGRPGHIDL